MRRTLGFGVAVAGMMVSVGLAADGKKLPFEVSKETTVVVGPLREDGTVDYAGALNERYGKGIKAEDNGFAEWLKVVGTGEKVFYPQVRERTLALLGAQGMKDGEVWESYMDYLTGLGKNGNEVGVAENSSEVRNAQVWKRGDDEMLAGYLEKEAGVLGRAEEAVKMEKWWVPTVSRSGMLMGAMMPTLGVTRDVANRLSERAMLRAGMGDAKGFMEDIGTIKRLARHVGSGRTLIERLVGVAIDQLASRAVAGAGNGGAFSAEQCAEIRKFCDGFGPMPALKDAVHEFERWTLLDFAERLAIEHEGVFSTSPTEQQMVGLRTIEWSQVDWNIVLRRINGTYDEAEELMRRPAMKDVRKGARDLDARLEAWHREAQEKYGGMLWQVKDETREAYSERVARAILGLLFSEFGRAEELERRGPMMEAMGDVVLDAAAARARTGKWPVEMEGLPADIYSVDGKEAVKYVVREGGVEVYSVGDNGRDDGGIRGGEKNADDLGVGAVPEVVEGK